MCSRYLAAAVSVALVCLPAQAGGYGPPQGSGGGGGSGVPTSRQVATSAPLTGGGDLTADRTLGIAAVSSNESLLSPLNGSSGTPGFRPLDSVDLGGISWTGDTRGHGTAQTVWAIQGRSVSTTAPTDAQVYAWNASTSQWVPTTPSGGGGGSYPITPSSGAATASGIQSLAIGDTASCGAFSGGLAVGFGASCSANAVAMGSSASSTAGGTAIGYSATATGQTSVVVGDLAAANNTGSIVLGYSASDTAAHQFVAGSTSGLGQITDVYFGGVGGSPWVLHGSTGSTTLGAGIQVGSPTGGDEGAGTINVAGNLYVNGVAVGGGGSTYPLTITAKTSDFTATSNTFTSNVGASADIVCTLPASPSVGDVFQVDVIAAHYVKILCPGSQQLYFGTTSTGAAGYWRSNAPGSTAFLRYDASNVWVAVSTGTWTVNS